MRPSVLRLALIAALCSASSMRVAHAAESSPHIAVPGAREPTTVGAASAFDTRVPVAKSPAWHDDVAVRTRLLLDALVDVRLYYRQSAEARAEGKWEPFADYNGQKYLLVLKASGVPRLDANPVARYVELVFGYGVRGYDPPGAARSRHLYAGAALNLSRVLDDTVFRGRPDAPARKGTGMFLELFQLPGTIALAERKL